MDRRVAEALARKAESMAGRPPEDSAEWMDALQGEPYVEALYAAPSGRVDEFRAAVIASLQSLGSAGVEHERRVDAAAAVIGAVQDLFAASQRSGAEGLLDVGDELQRAAAERLRATVERVITRQAG